MARSTTPRRPLFAQVLAINALVVLATVFVASLVSQLRLDAPLQHRELLVYVMAIGASLVVNAVLLRRRFAPLERLVAQIEAIDFSQPSAPLTTSRTDSREQARLNAAFNRMLDRLYSERREGSRAILRAQESERRRLAQDLHDEVNQALTAVVLRLEASIQAVEPAMRGELEETKRLGQQAMDELLRLARELRPTALDDHGLVPALQNQVTRFGDRTKLAAHFRTHGDQPTLSDEQQLVIYRVVQEGLSNVVQHAHATRVDVELSFVGRTVLQLRDNGTGFVGRRVGGLGLSGMRERAVLIGARLDIRSRPGSGTTVELSL